SNVLAWVGEDKKLRVVNTQWLQEEAEIAEFVTGPAPLGRRCRFCTAVEPAQSLELHALNSDRRDNLDVLASGMSGKRQVVLQYGHVHTHGPCAEYWNRWADIARKVLRERAA